MSIRIQSGTARGRVIKFLPKGLEVRPILARIRKSLFDIIRFKLQEAVFLDMFCGTGTVGLEALSNGAQRAVFFDASRKSVRMAQKNIDSLGFTERADVVVGDATKQLARISGQKYDIIFMGPPYKDEEGNPLALTVPTLTHVADLNLIKEGSWVIVQHHQKESLAGLPPLWEIFREQKYGDTILTFFKLSIIPGK